MTHHVDLDALVLGSGSHRTRCMGVCLVEAAAWWAGERHTDHPDCVSPVLAAFGRSWNDGMRSDEEREQLKPYITRLVGTAGDAEADERRAWLATDWLVRVCAPACLRLTASLVEHANRLAALEPVTSAAYAASVQGDITAAAEAAAAAAPAGFAWVAGFTWVAGVAAAAWAAWAAAAAAAAGAVEAAEAAAVAGAVEAAEAAAVAAPAGAAGAARAALEPTILELQQSAHELFDRMIEVRPTVTA